jgi:two-component system sensor histidine kinase UhpB
MSLKLRLILSIGISFALALLLGGALATWRAKQSVQTEMQAALKGGADIVDDVSRARPSDLERIVRSFNGLRHLRATLTDGGGKVVAASTPALPADEAPSWFERPIAPPNASLRLSARRCRTDGS